MARYVNQGKSTPVSRMAPFSGSRDNPAWYLQGPDTYIDFHIYKSFSKITGT